MPAVPGVAILCNIPTYARGRRQGQLCNIPTYAQGPPPERPVQHPHLRSEPPAGRPMQCSHLRPGPPAGPSSATSPPTPRGRRQSNRCSVPTYAQERSIGPGKQGIPPPLGTHYATPQPADGQVSSARIPGPVACRQAPANGLSGGLCFPRSAPCRPPVQHPQGCSRPVILFRMRNRRQGHRWGCCTDAYSCLMRRT